MTIKTENWLGEYTSTIGTGDITLGGAIDGFAGFSNVGENVDVYYTVMDALDKETGIGTLTGGKLVRKDIHAILVDGAYVKNGSAINLSGNAQVYGTANAHFLDYVQAVANAKIVNTQAIAELKALQINGHALTASFNLTAADVGAHPASWMPSTDDLNVYRKDASDIRYLKTQDAEQVAGLVMRVGGAREQQLQQSINDVSTAMDVGLRGDINIVVKTFSSVAEMVSDGALTIGMHVKWESYHAGLFLGGNQGVVVAANTGAADGGVYFTLANGLQVKSFTPNAGYAVTHFGAVGDGAHTTQDTAAFQASANIGEAILVPQPSAYYGIDTSNGGAGIVPANTGTKFISLSLAEIRLMSSRCNIFSNFLRDFTLHDYGPITDFYCEGLYFNSNKDNLTDPASASFPTGDNYSFGVYMVKCKNVELRHCKFANSWYGGHNLFSVLGQKVIACEYSNIGPSNAYYPDYAAMGSDADYRALSGGIIYRDIAVNNCGAVLRANGGINNGQTGISKKWLIENLSASDCLRGVALFGSGYDDLLFKHIRFNNISKGRLISVSGEGARYSRATPVSNVRYEDVMAIDCLNDASATNSALFYINASSGVNSVENISIIGGNSSGNANDLIVFSGEYTGASTQAAGQFIVDKYKIKTAGTPSSHVRLNTTGQISIKRVTHDSLASVRMLNIAAGSDVDISDNDVIASGFVASSYISRNWGKGSLRNIRGFKTYAAGLASVANNGTVAHGLVEAPPMINATMRQAGTPYIIGVTADANNITFAITDNAGVVVSSPVSVAWEARCWHEIPL